MANKTYNTKGLAMEYWIAFKNGKYVSGTDEFGYPVHTTEKSKAYKFYNFNIAMTYFNLGYAIMKEWEIQL